METKSKTEMETKNESNKDIGCCKRIERIPFIGYIAIIISAMFFAFLGVAVNILEKDIHPIQTLFVSYFLVGYLSFAFVIFADLSLKPFPGEAKYLIGRCIVGALTSFASYQSITILKLGDATAIIQSAPVYISIIAFIFLGEPCGVVLIVLIIMNFIGVLLIAKPSFIFSRSNNSTVSEQNGTEDSSSFGLVLANAAALGTAIHTILLRKLKETPISVTIFWTSIAVLLLAAAYLAFINQFKVPLIAKPYLFILIATVCILVAQGLQTLALRVEKAGPISLVRQVQVVFAFIDQVVILGDEVEFTSIVGAMIIVLTVIFTGLFQLWQNSRHSSSNENENSENDSKRSIQKNLTNSQENEKQKQIEPKASQLSIKNSQTNNLKEIRENENKEKEQKQ